MRSRLRSFRKQKEDLDVDITSLLDVLTILLFFLLKSYNASDLTVDLVEQLTLPVSSSEALGADAITIQVNSEQKVWVNNIQIGELDQKSKGQTIPFLLSKLEELKAANDEAISKFSARTPSSMTEEEDRKQKSYKMVNIVLDQTLPYEVLRKVMHTSATAGFPEFKFIIQSHHD